MLLIIVTILAIVTNAIGYLKIEGLPSGIVIGFVLAMAAISFMNRAVSSIETAGLSFKRVNLDRILTPIFFLVCALAAYAFGVAGVIAITVIFIVSKLPMLVVRIARFRKHLTGPIDHSLLRETLTLGPPMFLAVGAQQIGMQADRFIITSIWPPEWLGFYFVAMSTCGAGLMLASQAIRLTLLPTLAGLSLEERRDKIERLIRLSLVAAFGLSVLVLIAAPIVIPLAYGKEFAPAVFFVQGLMVAMALRPTISIVSIANRAGERSRPGVEIGIILTVFLGLGWLLTGFSHPVELFVTMAVANAAAIAVGMRHLVKEGSCRPARALLPGPRDFVFLTKASFNYALKRATKALAFIKWMCRR